LEQTNDQNLLAAMQQGEQSAFDTLFRVYYAPLCRYACTLTDGNLDDAEDIVQQVFIKFWDQRALMEIQWSVKAYLYKMVYNRCLNRIRDARTQLKYKIYNAQQLEQGHEPSPDGAQELNERLQKALLALPTECRRIFELSRFETLKYREIADQLGISIKTVEAQMGKALRVLRVELSDYLVTLLGLVMGWLVGW
jgi:RNA polymerase sigma-70 factor (ECF subfamily)